MKPVLLQETALDELEAGQEALRVAGSERTDQLKALVKQNFERFISCKTTIDDVHVRLRGAEVGGRGASGGASTEDVSKAVAAVRPCFIPCEFSIPYECWGKRQGYMIDMTRQMFTHHFWSCSYAAGGGGGGWGASRGASTKIVGKAMAAVCLNLQHRPGSSA